MSTGAPDEGAIAVVGLGCVFPGAPDVDTFWRNVVGGVDATSEVPADRIDPVLLDALGPLEGAAGAAVHRGGFVDGAALSFDPGRFGIMPVAVDGTEPDQLLALATAAAAIDDVGGLADVALERVGVVLGRGGYLTPGVARLEQRVRTVHQVVATLRTLLPELDEHRLAEVGDAFVEQLGPSRPETSIGLVPNLAASRIANRLDLGGPAYTVDAACASALVAVDHAVTELRSGRCDVVLAGGVHHCHDITLWSVFHQLGALSPSGTIRPFSRHADGILVGEGTGILVLERLADAERHGHRVYATIAGTGLSSDGRDASLMSPRVDGQVLALERAYQAAGIDPVTVGLVEGHGTATAAGDRAELDTLRRVFGKPDDEVDGVVAPVLGSVKSMIGHAMPAAGAAGLIKAVLSVHHGLLPPTLGVDEPHPALAETRFRTLAAVEPWEQEGPRRAGVDAFGFGGINAHVVVEGRDPGGRNGGTSISASPRPADTSGAPAGRELDAILLAGRDAADLAAQLALLPADRLPVTAAPAGGPARLAIVDPTPKRLELAARVLERGRPWRGRNDLWFEPDGLVAAGGRVAFLFPGVEPTFDAELEPVAEWFGRRLPALPDGCTPLEAQGRQIFAAGRLLHAALADLGVEPDDIAGHSLGEWTGVFTADLIEPGRAGGFLDDLRPGALEVPGVVYLALGCGVDQAAGLIEGVEGVTVSHDNCPHQSIVCGPPEGIEVVRERVAEQRLMAQELPFRSGFHSPAFAPYLDIVHEHWAKMPLQAPRVPLWSATTCEPYPDDPDAVRALAAEHLVEPVRFRELTERLHDAGTRVFVQLGVGSLVGFVEDTLRDREHLAITAHTSKRSGLDQLTRVAAALWVEGVDVDLGPLQRPAGRTAARPARSGPLVPLTLGVPLVQLPESAALGVGSLVVEPAGTGHVTTGPVSVPAGAEPLRAAHDALVSEAVDASRAVLDALAALGSDVPAIGVPAAEAPTPAADVPVTRTATVDTTSSPWLLDHAFYRQPEGWADTSDLFPVVPMTAMLEMLASIAAEAAPGEVVTTLESVRAMRWLPAAPANEVTLRARRLDDGRIEAVIEGYARATVRTAATRPEAPAPAHPPLHDLRPSPLDARQIYEQHFMFHGPAYQGVRHIEPLGANGVDGVIEVMAAPGATVDAAGQLYGWWVMASADTNFLALPQSIERVELFADPPVGAALDTTVRIGAFDERTVSADLELCHEGRVTTRITGWVDRRFDSTEALWLMLREPEHHLLGTPRGDGVVVVDEGWPDSASRELMARRYLTAAEREIYESLNPRAQRHHLLGRIAAKDAVRHALWSEGHGPIFPAEIVIANDPGGRPYVAAGPGAGRPLSISHTSWVGAALVGPAGGAHVGVDIEAVEERTTSSVRSVLSDDELALLPSDPDTGELTAEWFTRAWSAKEVSAKVAGTGLSGRPKDFPITAVDGERLLVAGRWVRTTIDHPTDTPEEQAHVVAWTDPDR